MFSLAPPPGTRAEAEILEALAWAASKSGLPASPGAINWIVNHRERARTIGLALGYIMNKRKNDCGNKSLAYADHYLQARVMVAYLGPEAAPMVETLVVGYEVKKKIWEALGILDQMQSDKRCPSPVSPDSMSVKWGLSGAEDGKLDFYIDTAVNATEIWKSIFP
jgi:hypothetical protein